MGWARLGAAHLFKPIPRIPSNLTADKSNRKLGHGGRKRTSWPSQGPLNHRAWLFFRCQGVSGGGGGESRPSWINGLGVRRWEEAR